jgi:hypothetical protein
VLGNVNVKEEVWAPYPYGAENVQLKPDEPTKVNRGGRFLISHGTGRFIVVGTEDQDPPEKSMLAFQAYDPMGVFSRLGDCTGNSKDHNRVIDISSFTQNNFTVLNVLLIVVALGFVGFYAFEHDWANNAIDPVVVVKQAAPSSPDPLVDLSSLLQEQAEPARPAIVVVGSGGGTRAALYTASVLKGLHALGVDRDIVLASAVSGGGVALASRRPNRAGPARPKKRTLPRKREYEYEALGRGGVGLFYEGNDRALHRRRFEWRDRMAGLHYHLPFQAAC